MKDYEIELDKFCDWVLSVLPDVKNTGDSPVEFSYNNVYDLYRDGNDIWGGIATNATCLEPQLFPYYFDIYRDIIKINISTDEIYFIDVDLFSDELVTEEQYFQYMVSDEKPFSTEIVLFQKLISVAKQLEL